MRSHRQAGASALSRFRQERRTVMRRNWKDWVGLAVGALSLVAGIAFTDGLAQLLLAWTLGALCMMAMVGWIIGGDVSSLTWRWGAVGEQATGELLKALPAEWHVEHDIAHGYGNYDHVLAGPPGVFLLDTKNLRGKAIVKDDALRSGRMRFTGSSFRGAAVGLKETLEAEVGPPLFVKAVVVVWGDFPQKHVEQSNVTYVAAGELRTWLEQLPARLAPQRREALVHATRHLAQASEAQPVPQLKVARAVSRDLTGT